VGIARRSIESADLIVIVWDAKIDSAVWSQAVDGQVANQETASRRLTDVRTADSSTITEADVEAMATILGNNLDVSGVKLAIVAAAGWNVAQQFEESTRKFGITTVVFNDVATACAWLGVDVAIASSAIDGLREQLRADARPGESDPTLPE
jgi:hypothetical protein